MKIHSTVIFVSLFLSTLSVVAQNGLVAHWSFDELRIYDRALTSSEVFDLFQNPTSINTIRNDIAEIKIFPNPAKEILYFDLSDIVDKIVLVKLTDVNGKVAITQKISSSDKEFYIGKLPEGLYIVDFIGEKNIYQGKVMIAD